MLQVVGVKMAVWSTKANETLCALSGRLPAMADRSWNPQAGRSYADYQIRVASTTRVLAALLFVHSAIAVYSLLVKSATNDGVDPGLFVLIRDCNTVSACVRVSVHNPRHAVLVPR